MTKTVAAVVALACAPALGSITSIGAFTGASSEGFEWMSPGGIDGALPNESDPVTILGGAGTLSGTHVVSFDPIYVWNSTGGLSLGTPVAAVPFDGLQGITAQSIGATNNPTIRIDFVPGVTQFGGYWAHANYQGNAGPVDLTFYDAGGGVIGTDSFNYDWAGLSGVLEWFGWESTVDIAAVEWTGYWATVDGLQVNAVPAPASMLALIGAAAVGRRRR